MRITHIVKEMARNLYRNFGTALGSLLSLTLLFLLFDLFWVAAGTSRTFYLSFISDLQMDVFVTEETSDTALVALEDSVRRTPGVSDITYVSKQQARLELSGQVGTDLLVGYDSLNPLPRSFILTFQPEYLNLNEIRRIEARLGALNGVSEVNYSRRWLEKVEETRAIILQVGLGLGVIILLAALLSSANNIRLMARARAVGFRQMLLLGAGRFFIAAPFILEGFFMAATAAALGWVIIYYGQQQVTFSQFEIVVPLRDHIIAFCLACGVIGMFSGYLGIRSELKA